MIVHRFNVTLSFIERPQGKEINIFPSPALNSSLTDKVRNQNRKHKTVRSENLRIQVREMNRR